MSAPHTQLGRRLMFHNGTLNTPRRIRTLNLLIRSQRLQLQGLNYPIFLSPRCNQTPPIFRGLCQKHLTGVNYGFEEVCSMW